ncbi:outer membrane beta-barrel family protein [Zobellia uliginosa]|uniref:outer membrane beta-barrel family protein n=1 Tax=Zobellia uliginosa TaxID=143224 RepID=UPI0026E1FD54|nr:outer membrane beta-barrel family protein [Zobellia uliginosa]MDO6516114.1 outer membrane beta-barrel family protein [Zobellia uliginosa]
MKRFLCPLFLMFFFNGVLYSQELSVKGVVNDREDQAVAFANVLLLSATDSTLVTGTSTDEAGAYAIQNITAGRYLIKASYIGNESNVMVFELETDKELAPLVLKDTDQKLDEVVVTSQKPRLERKIDRLVFNVENTAYADGDVWDVLKITPSVMIVNDKLSVKGSNSVGLLINGRKINIPHDDIVNLLSGTSASNVENIEVITNPPAKYSAEESVLINIVMKKNIIAGYNGAVYNKYVQGVLPKHTIGTDHFFKGKKSQLSFNYNFGHDRKVVYYTDITNFPQNDGSLSTWTAEQEHLNRSKAHNFSLFFDYDISENSRLSFTSITLWEPEIARVYDTDTELTGDSRWSSFETLNHAEKEKLNTSYYVDYIQDLGNNGEQLSFNAHYTFYDESDAQLLNTAFYNTAGGLAGENDFTTDASQKINLYSFQGDYEAPLGDKGKIETGLRYAGIASNSSILQEGFDRDQPGIDPSASSNFDYDESIYAAYVSYSGKWDRWKLKTGLRAEYAQTEGEWDMERQFNERKNFQLFPSGSIQFSPSEKHDLNLYYFRKISRPRYNSINPFQTFQSTFSTIEGDPELLPSTRYYIAAGYTYDKSYTVELFYKRKKNGLEQLIFQNNDNNLLRFISSNLDQEWAYGIDLSLNKNFTDFYNCYVLASFYSETFRFANLSTNAPVELDQFSWFVRTSNSFSFLSDRSLTADLNLIYTAPMLSGNSKFDAFGALNLMFRKTFYDKKLSITLGVEDIFNQGNQFNTRNYQDQNGTSLQRGENRLLVAGLRYRFGNSKIRDNKKSKRVEERNRI